MIKKVELSTGKVLDPSLVMPNIPTGHKVGIFFTGGVESTLVALMMIATYGIDNVVFVFMSLDKYSNYKTNKSKFQRIKGDFEDRVRSLGGIHTIEIDNDDQENFDKLYRTTNIVDWARIKINKKNGPCEHIFAGYSNIHRENMTLLEECGWEKTMQLREQVMAWFANHADDYPETRDFLYNCNGMIYFVAEAVPFTVVQQHFYSSVRPLQYLTKDEVIEVFYKLNLEKELAKTISCNRPEVGEGEHCGECKNCRQRQMAFEISGYGDPTIYRN